MERGIYNPEQKEGQSPSGKNYLLAIGIDQYQHWPKLKNAVKDAQDVIDLLVKHYQFETDHVTALFDQEATESNIYQAIRTLKRSITSEDNLLIYYSGHGHYDEEFDEGAWVPVDASEDSEDGYIKNVNIIHKLNAIDSHHTLLIVDSCFSGTLVVRKRAAVVDERFKSRRILASGRNETVSDGQAGTNSPFAAGLLTFLKKNTDKSIKTTHLIEYVKDYLYTKARQTPVEGRLQNSADEGGEFVFHLKVSEADLWQTVQKEDSLKAYQNYLDTYPEGQFAVVAERKILEFSEQDIWKSAKIKDTETAYENYIKKYPTGAFLAEAKQNLQKLQEARVKRTQVLEEMAAKASERANIRAQYDALIAKAELHFQNRELPEAKANYQEAQRFYMQGFVPDLEYIDNQLAFCANGIRFLDHYEKGKSVLKLENFRLALEYFQEAQRIDDNPKLDDLIRYCRLKLNESKPSPIIEEEIRAELNPPPLPQEDQITERAQMNTDVKAATQSYGSTVGASSVVKKGKRKRGRRGTRLIIGLIVVVGMVAAYQLYLENQRFESYDPVVTKERSVGPGAQNTGTYSSKIIGRWTLRDFTYDGQSVRNSQNSAYIDLMNMNMIFQTGNRMQYQDVSGSVSVSNYYINDQTGSITIQNYLGGINGTIRMLNQKSLVISFYQTDAYGVTHNMMMTLARQ